MLKKMKDELTKSKQENARLKTDLDTASRSRSMEPEAAAEWEQERQSLHREIEEIQNSVKESHSQLESQLSRVQSDLHSANQERDRYRQNNEQVQQQLAHHTQQTRTELDALKNENTMLETRALDAEQKVTLLLDQVGTSVGNYRRQSQQLNNGAHNHAAHARNLSTISTTSTTAPTSFPTHSHTPSTSDPPTTTNPSDPNRSSLALDHLASELETLRSHWADTHRTYRLSSQFDFERSTPTSATGPGGMSDSLASWRKRLDAEEGGRGSGESERVREKMPGGLVGGSSDEEEEEGVMEGGGRGSKSYVI